MLRRRTPAHSRKRRLGFRPPRSCDNSLLAEYAAVGDLELTIIAFLRASFATAGYLGLADGCSSSIFVV